MIAFVCPGQGAQTVGMGKMLADRYPEARATFNQADAALLAESPEGAARLLSSLIFDGPEDLLTLTENTQPAILTVSVAAARVLRARGIRPAFVAGHSLGEYSANVIAETMTFDDAVRIVRRRGRYMQEAVPVGEGAMAAILGLSADAVRQACEEASHGDVVSPANINGAGQVVIAGATQAVIRAMDRAKQMGAKRTIRLTVSAPFHCALMKPAEERLAPELRALPVKDPEIPVVANVDGEPKRAAAAAVDALVRQVSAPVQWEAVVRRLASEGVTTYVEVGPGTVLSGLIRKIQKEATVHQFGAPEDLARVVEACST